MDAWLEGPVTSVAYGWRLERGDGVAIGFTSHDHDVEQDGLLLRASPGMKPTTIIESVGLEQDGLDVSGALTADAICAADLKAGRWDGAYLEIFLFDWSMPDGGRRLLANGALGAVSFSADTFEAEFLGLKSVLDRPVAPQTSPSCRACFCDSACGLNRERFRHVGSILEIDGNRIIIGPFPPVAANAFGYGELRWLEGDNCGLVTDVIGSDATSLFLPVIPQGQMVPGERIELVEGCDKLMTTCAGRFDNGLNFRGEPYLPGNALLTRYPGAN